MKFILSLFAVLYLLKELREDPDDFWHKGSMRALGFLLGAWVLKSGFWGVLLFFMAPWLYDELLSDLFTPPQKAP